MPAQSGPMRGAWNPALLARLQQVRRETGRALDAVQVGEPVQPSWWEAVEQVRQATRRSDPAPGVYQPDQGAP